MKFNTLNSITKMFLVSALVFLMGCGGGGGGDGSSGPAATPSIQVTPSAYDFGTVTTGNTAAPLEVKIKNAGSANLTISGITSIDNNFSLNVNGGSNPCLTTSPTISAGNTCTVEVSFNPQLAGSIVGSLQIKSNDSRNPTTNIGLTGTSKAVETVSVKINQVSSDLMCPTAKVTAYVSVIDQGGYPIRGLVQNNFRVSENSNLVTVTGSTFVGQVTAPISIALVMDYSESMTEIPELVSDMEAAAVDFVNQMGADDEAEIIKVATEIQVAQVFTSDKNLLIDAIHRTADLGRATRLYDGAWKAVDDVASRQKSRKTVIVLTDGKDDDGTPDHNQLSSKNLSDVIDHAIDNGLPIFTVGMGNYDQAVLGQMADDTGGEFYASASSDNLRNIYFQLADVLFEDQYIINYISAAASGATATLAVEAEVSQTVKGSDTRDITPCP